MAAARHSESGGKPRTVAVLLPHREIYSAVGAGAVSICVRDICAASAWRDGTVVFGAPVEAPFEGVAFQSVQSASWVHGSRTSRYLAGAVRQLRRLQPAVIEVHNRPQYIGPLRRKLPRVPLLLYLHNDPRLMKGLATPAERARLLDRVAAVVCVSDYIRRCMLDGLQAHSGCDKVHANLNGIDTGRFAPPADHDKRPEVLFVGRLTPDKGALLFAEAVHKALPQLAGWRAVLVGSRWFRDAPRVTDFEREVTGHLEALGAQGEIAGYLTHEQVMARFRDAAIAVVPSLWDEPCSLTAIEAMASGCALIATARGGLPEVVGDAGVILQQDNAAALADEMVRLATGDDARADFQRRARRRAEQLLDIGRTARTLDAVRGELAG